MKGIILVILFLITINIAYAYTGKIIYNIPHCYNLTIRVDLLNGNYSNYYFDNCILNNNLWVCNCKDSEQFNLTIESDPSMLKDPHNNLLRMYLNYSTYNINEFSNILTVRDHGLKAFTDYDPAKLTGTFCDIQYVDRYVIQYVNVSTPTYINQTVYVDRNVTEYVDRIVYIQNYTKNPWWQFWR